MSFLAVGVVKKSTARMLPVEGHPESVDIRLALVDHGLYTSLSTKTLSSRPCFCLQLIFLLCSSNLNLSQHRLPGPPHQMHWPMGSAERRPPKRQPYCKPFKCILDCLVIPLSFSPHLVQFLWIRQFLLQAANNVTVLWWLEELLSLRR